MKKLFAILTVLASLVFLLPVSAEGLSDIEDSEHKMAIEYLYSNGSVEGNADGTFRPDTFINRAEFLKLLFVFANIEAEGENCFTDVSTGVWYERYVCEAKRRNIVSGYSDTTFRPARFVSRGEALKMMGEMLEWDIENIENADLPYLDAKNSLWFTPYVAYVYTKNIFEQRGRIFFPEQKMTRGEVAEVLFRHEVINALSAESYNKDSMVSFLESAQFDKTPDEALETGEEDDAEEAENISQKEEDVEEEDSEFELDPSHPLYKHFQRLKKAEQPTIQERCTDDIEALLVDFYPDEERIFNGPFTVLPLQSDFDEIDYEVFSGNCPIANFEEQVLIEDIGDMQQQINSGFTQASRLDNRGLLTREGTSDFAVQKCPELLVRVREIEQGGGACRAIFRFFEEDPEGNPVIF